MDVRSNRRSAVGQLDRSAFESKLDKRVVEEFSFLKTLRVGVGDGDRARALLRIVEQTGQVVLVVAQGRGQEGLTLCWAALG